MGVPSELSLPERKGHRPRRAPRLDPALRSEWPGASGSPAAV